jgi:hypothetical protein
MNPALNYLAEKQQLARLYPVAMDIARSDQDRINALQEARGLVAFFVDKRRAASISLVYKGIKWGDIVVQGNLPKVDAGLVQIADAIDMTLRRIRTARFVHALSETQQQLAEIIRR